MQKQLSPATAIVIVLIVVIIVVAVGWFVFLKPKGGGDDAEEMGPAEMQRMMEQGGGMGAPAEPGAETGMPGGDEDTSADEGG